MSNENEIDQFIRHLQAELEDCSSIVDLQLREQRQWQIEIAIQEGLKYLKKIDERKLIGDSKIFREIDPVRIIKKKSDLVVKKVNPDSESDCPKCDEGVIGDLGFCESCGYRN
ncbi:MAG: hypothetical protein CMB56_007205 [Methanobacteriota archaeon]|nr:MAG: hypothetical protein CMB56_007205 [Euryarchaeota archaeon]